MRHNNKYAENKLLELGNLLELKREDIKKIVGIITHPNQNQKINPLFYEPINCYKSDGSYYGTISIKDFNKN